MEISKDVKDKLLKSTGKLIFFRNGSYKYIPSERYQAFKKQQESFVGGATPKSIRVNTLKQSASILQRVVCQPELIGKKPFI